MLADQDPVVLLQHAGLNSLTGKTGLAMLRHRRGPIVAVIDPDHAGLFGAQRSSGRQGFRSCRHWRPVVVTLRGAASGAPVNICLSEGWPTTSIPSLEERLDDHQPTRAWEHREDSG